MAVIKGGYEIVKRAMLKELMKRGDDGIMLTLPKNEIVDLNTKITMDRLIKAGVDPESLTSPEQVINILESINNQMFKNIKAISADSAEGKKITDKLFGKKGEVVDMTGKKIDTSQGIMGCKSVKELMDSGEVTKGTVSKKNNKVVEREMFSEANERFNKTDVVADTVTKITSMEPVAALKEANKIVGRKGIYKNLTEEQSQKILKDTDDWIFQRDPSDLYDYKNKRPFRDDPNFDPDDPDFDPDPDQGYYTGGMVDVEPNLSDIGHGSDSLMARTRLISPNNQATTSTGLNYLLAEDNDNIRVPFSAGGGGRRAFLKLMAMLGGGIAGLKSGIIGFGGKKEGIRQATKNIIKTDNVPGKPEWFDTLVTKVINEGDDVTKKFATKEREIVHSKNLDDNTTVRVTQDIDEGAIRVEYDSADNVFEDTVQLQYKKPLPDEANPNPQAEFTTAESGPVGRQVGPDDYDMDIDEVGGSSIKDLDSDVSKLKEYATGKKPTLKELVENKKRKDRAKQISNDQEAQSDAIVRRQGDYDPSDYDDYAGEDFASGGLAGMLGE